MHQIVRIVRHGPIIIGIIAISNGFPREGGKTTTAITIDNAPSFTRDDACPTLAPLYDRREPFLRVIEWEGQHGLGI